MAYNFLNRSFEPWLDSEEFIVEIKSKFEDFTAPGYDWFANNRQHGLMAQDFAVEMKTFLWFCLLELTVLIAR